MFDIFGAYAYDMCLRLAMSVNVTTFHNLVTLVHCHYVQVQCTEYRTLIKELRILACLVHIYDSLFIVGCNKLCLTMILIRLCQVALCKKSALSAFTKPQQ